MAKFLIEVPHASSQLGCLEAIQAFLHSGSHFLVNADWGCMDGEHVAWLTLEADDKDQARSVIPIPYRANAKITRLTKYTQEKVQKIIDKHIQ
ncbi:MAG TPA: hypothetical protein VJ965_12390 [Anaerolineales bacterium]|nr:hypothetical protein [Anaerolineales bacterium]